MEMNKTRLATALKNGITDAHAIVATKLDEVEQELKYLNDKWTTAYDNHQDDMKFVNRNELELKSTY